MKVYALVGKSGTGKSYQAMNLCKEKNIESIIDDGLYIYRNNAVGGASAKRDPTKIGAIKTALFTKDEHQKQVRELICETEPENILIIGTSDEMVNKIQNRLGLPKIDETIYIEDITTEWERQIARKQRLHQGKHVVPVPTFQLKRQFSGYFMDPLRIFRGLGFGKDSFAERSVVRPTYSYMGEFLISDRVITEIIEYTAAQVPGVHETYKIVVENTPEEMYIRILAGFLMEDNVVEVAKALQKQCVKTVEEMTAFHIEQINVEVRWLI